MKKFIIIMIILLSSINVLAEDLDNNANLNNLKLMVLQDGNLVDMIKFKQTTKSYEVTINTNEFTLTGETESSKAMVDGLETYTIALNETKEINVTVTAEDGTTNIYNFKVKYVEPKSTNNNLSNIEILYEDEPLDFVFDKNLTEFTYTVDSNITSVYIKATCEDDKAVLVNNYGNRTITLNYGSNKKEIRVLAENNKTKSYFITIIRTDDRSTNNTLSSLTVNGKKIDLVEDVYEYKVDVRYNQTRSNIEAKSGNSNAKIEFEEIDLVEGTNNPIIIKVSNEQNDIKEYKIIINKLKEDDSKVLLESISINNHNIEFNKNIYNYTVVLNKNETKLEFTILPNVDDGIEVEFIGNKDLKDKSTVIVRIIDDDGEHRYTFNIEEEKVFSKQNIICYSVAIIGIFSFIYSVIVALKKK